MINVTKDTLLTALKRVGILGSVQAGYFDKLFEPGGDETKKDGFGWFNYDSSIESQEPTPNVWTTLLNDGLANTTNTSFSPPGVTRLLDPTTGRFDLSELDVGDELYIRHTLNIIPLMNNLSYQLSHLSGSEAQAYRLPLGSRVSLSDGGGVPTDIFVLETRIFIRNEDVRLNGILPQILVNGPAQVEYTGCYLSVNRR